MNAGIAQQRLQNQHIRRARRRTPAEVVAWLGAVQAQEYPAARWALALRMPEGTTDAGIARAFDEGHILRTHVMRPTWHFVAPADIRWMLELTARHVHRSMNSYNRKLGLDAGVFNRGAAVVERALGAGQYLTRAELGLHLARARLQMDGQRLAHLAMYAELEGIICSGPRRGKQFTYALLAERAPRARSLARDEALAELTRRFFSSHGPATIRDFVWWSGLPTADARRGLDMNRARQTEVNGRVYWRVGRTTPARTPAHIAHLLPVYDEYLVAYRDRDAVPHGPSIVHSAGRAVMFLHALLIDGQIAGTWRPTGHGQAVAIDVAPLRTLSRRERAGIAEAAARYGRFLGAPVTLSIT